MISAAQWPRGRLDGLWYRRQSAYNEATGVDEMRRFRAYPFVGLVAFLVMPVASLGGTQTIGANPQLSAGARALQMGDYDEGIRLTLEGLKSHPLPPDRASALNNLCAGYVANRKFDEAIKRCSEAIEIDGRSWRIYNNRALAYLGRGQIRAATRDAQKGLALNPDGRTLAKVQSMIRDESRHILLADAD